MKPEHIELRDTLMQTFSQGFAEPTIPEAAQLRVVIAVGALLPLRALSLQDGEPADPAIADWLTPMVADLIDQAGVVLDRLYDELELGEDDVQIMEPGTIGNQQFQDMPTGPGMGGGPVVGPSGVPRGELIR